MLRIRHIAGLVAICTLLADFIARIVLEVAGPDPETSETAYETIGLILTLIEMVFVTSLLIWVLGVWATPASRVRRTLASVMLLLVIGVLLVVGVSGG